MYILAKYLLKEITQDIETLEGRELLLKFSPPVIHPSYSTFEDAQDTMMRECALKEPPIWTSRHSTIGGLWCELLMGGVLYVIKTIEPELI